jgi:hypothetical protein
VHKALNFPQNILLVLRTDAHANVGAGAGAGADADTNATGKTEACVLIDLAYGGEWTVIGESALTTTLAEYLATTLPPSDRATALGLAAEKQTELGSRRLLDETCLQHIDVWGMVAQQLVKVYAHPAHESPIALGLQHKYANLLSDMDSYRQVGGDGEEGASSLVDLAKGRGAARTSTAWIQNHGGVPDFYPAQ